MQSKGQVHLHTIWTWHTVFRSSKDSINLPILQNCHVGYETKRSADNSNCPLCCSVMSKNDQQGERIQSFHIRSDELSQWTKHEGLSSVLCETDKHGYPLEIPSILNSNKWFSEQGDQLDYQIGQLKVQCETLVDCVKSFVRLVTVQGKLLVHSCIL